MSGDMFKSKLDEVISFFDKLLGFIQWSREMNSDHQTEIIKELVQKQKILKDLRESGLL